MTKEDAIDILEDRITSVNTTHKGNAEVLAAIALAIQTLENLGALK